MSEKAPNPMYDAALSLAVFFHNTYESLAPSFGYETRPDTKSFDPDSKNGKLMVAVAHKVIAHFLLDQFQRDETIKGLREALESIATPDKSTNSFSILRDGERVLVAEWSLVQWRMDAASTALSGGTP